MRTVIRGHVAFAERLASELRELSIRVLMLEAAAPVFEAAFTEDEVRAAQARLPP